MGTLWFASNDVKRDVIAMYESSVTKALGVSKRGNIYYLLLENSHTGSRYIGVCKTSRARGEVGFKTMHETDHPYYYDCPKKFIEQCTEPMNQYSEKWRERVMGKYTNV